MTEKFQAGDEDSTPLPRQNCSGLCMLLSLLLTLLEAKKHLLPLSKTSLPSVACPLGDTPGCFSSTFSVSFSTHISRQQANVWRVPSSQKD